MRDGCYNLSRTIAFWGKQTSGLTYETKAAVAGVPADGPIFSDSLSFSSFMGSHMLDG